MIPTCEHCGNPMPTLARSHARYCSNRCRTAACRARNPIPAELRSRPRWVRYSARKVPLRLDASPASSTDPTTWSTYPSAARSNTGAGLGFVLNGDGLVCLDLDHCLDGETLTPFAAELLSAAGSTYVEVSPSGQGLHVWGYGHIEHGRRLSGVECYGTGRYITVTGKRYGATSSLADLSEVLVSL